MLIDEPDIAVEATITVDGWHSWSTAPERQKYLQVTHRHTFHITAWKAASHDDRAVECFDLADSIRRSLKPFIGQDMMHDFGHMACEHIARHVAAITNSYKVRVLEDGINGATIRLKPPVAEF